VVDNKTVIAHSVRKGVYMATGFERLKGAERSLICKESKDIILSVILHLHYNQNTY